MSDAYFLPPHTSALIDAGMPACKNLGLILDKYVPQDVIEESKKKGDWLKYLVQDQNHIFDAELLAAFHRRWQTMLNAFPITHTFTAALAWRMIIGLGGESVLETDFTLHHLYGTPFIPASALKGLTRAYAANEDERYFIPSNPTDQKLIPSPEPEKDHEELQRIFGSQKQAGSVLFFDAQPATNNISFLVDIMNPHYPDYYNNLKGNPKPPTNDQSPIPITFLTIAETSFLFALAPRNPQDSQHQEDAKQVQSWLKQALQKYGIGGKTSAGYGYFTINTGNDPLQQTFTGQAQIMVQEEPWQRPNIPVFSVDQPIQECFVTEPTEEMRQLCPTAKAFLRFRENPLKFVYVIIEEEIPDIQSWTLRQQKACLYQREERRGSSLVLICKPKPKSERSKTKGK